MSATDIAAWIGATSGLAAILLEFHKWLASGPRIKVSVNPGMKMMTKPGANVNFRVDDDHSDYLTIWVRNTGTAKTTITTISLATYDSWWSRRHLRQSNAGIIPEPLGHPIPHKLDVGEEWVGSVKQDQYIEEMLTTGNMWCDVYHAWSRRPAQVHVRLKPTSPVSAEAG